MIWNGNGVLGVGKKDYSKGDRVPIEDMDPGVVKKLADQGLLIDDPKPKAEPKAEPKPKPVARPKSMQKKKRGNK